MTARSDQERIEIHWNRLFGVAEEGFLARGRGAVFVREWSSEFVYITAVEARDSLREPNLMKALENYDPQQQVIVVVHHGTSADGKDLIARYELCRTDQNNVKSGSPAQ